VSDLKSEIRSSRRPGCDEDESEFETWLAQASERADPLMALLGLLFALLVGYELAVDLGPNASRWVQIIGWALWAVFLVEFLVKLWLAPRRTRFLRRHWLQALALAVPALRMLRFLRLVRLGRAMPAARVLSSSYRTAGSARRLLGSRLGYLGGLGLVVTIAVAELGYLFERDRPDSVFESFGHAVLWASSVVLAQQGDPVPNSAGAHIVMLVGFAFGLVIIASLAGILGAFLAEQRGAPHSGAQADAAGRGG
jgi:voltage-gated potassium channel